MNINSKERNNSANSNLTRRRTRSQKTSGSVCLHMKSCCLRAKIVNNISRNFYLCQFQAQGYARILCYSGSSQGMWVYIPCLFSISPEPISNTRMFSYFVHCILIIVYLLQGSVMEQPLISVIDKYYFYHRFGLKAFEGRHIRKLVLKF